MPKRRAPKATKRLRNMAAAQRDRRSERDRGRKCRTCGKPAAVNERTGKVLRQCRKHLDLDAERKALSEKEPAPRKRSVSIKKPEKVIRKSVKRPTSKKVGRDRDRDRVRLIRVDGEMVYPLTRRKVTGKGEKIVILSSGYNLDAVTMIDCGLLPFDFVEFKALPEVSEAQETEAA